MLSAWAVQARSGIGVVAAPLFVVGLGNGVWDVAQNLEGTLVEQALGRATMPWFHAAFSAGTVVAALVGALLTWWAVPLGAHLTVAAALCLAATLWATTRFLPASGEAAAVDQAVTATASQGARDAAVAAAARPARSAWLEPRTLLIGVMVLAAAFAEGTANDWMAVAFVDGHDLRAALGVVALAVFLVAMTAGRVFGTRLLDRHGRVAVLRVLFVLAVVGCGLVVLAPTPLAFVGAAVWGLGASLGFPVGMSAAADDPARAPMRLSVVSTVGYLAFLGGPPLLGFLGDHVGVLHALLAVGVMSLLALLVVPVAAPRGASDRPAGSGR